MRKFVFYVLLYFVFLIVIDDFKAVSNGYNWDFYSALYLVVWFFLGEKILSSLGKYKNKSIVFKPIIFLFLYVVFTFLTYFFLGKYIPSFYVDPFYWFIIPVILFVKEIFHLADKIKTNKTRLENN